MQTIGKIINGKYVRYGAVSVGDKLGDAAFANIVNNATTTEEGFVPDARVVAQQQQIITQQQEQIDSLNSAMNSISGVCDDSTMVNATETLKSVWASLPNDTIGTTALTASGPKVGCIYYKLRDDYGAALLITYYVSRPAYVIKTHGQWGKPIWL